jgi:FdhD protein
MDDISSMEIKDGEAFINRRPGIRGKLPRMDLLESTGSRNVDLFNLPDLIGRASSSELKIPAKVIIDGVQRLSQMPLYSRTGGTHCAILFAPDGQLLCSSEDIGRHNSVDKTIGGALMKRVDFRRCWLAVSGRLPADMVVKPALVGIPLVASISAPTLNGVRTGEKSGMTVVGFVRGGRLNCYSHPERIFG